MKRVLSIMLTLMLAFTMMSGITVNAGDEYETVTSFTGGNDFSTIFSGFATSQGFTMQNVSSSYKSLASVDKSTLASDIAAGATSAKVLALTPLGSSDPTLRFKWTSAAANVNELLRIKFKIYLANTVDASATYNVEILPQIDNGSYSAGGLITVYNVQAGQWLSVDKITTPNSTRYGNTIKGVKITLKKAGTTTTYPTTVYLDGNIVIEKVKVAESDEAKVAADKGSLTLGNTSAVTKNLTLPTAGANGSTITWATSDASVITNAGVITPGTTAKTATLTATLTLGNVTDTKEFDITVSALPAVSLASCFMDNMVIQRNQPIKVWGTSTVEDKTVTITLGDKSATTQTNSTGKWSVTLPAMSATAPGTGLTLNMTCNDEAGTNKTITNVAIGEIILAAGQSNMNRSVSTLYNATVTKTVDEVSVTYDVTELADDKAEVQAAVANLTNVDVRMLNLNDITANSFTWARVTEYKDSSAANCIYHRSLIGFMTAYKLAVQENITVAFADVAYGGAAIRSFLSPETINARDEYSSFTKADPLGTAHKTLRYQASGLYNIWLSHIKGMKFGSVIWYQGEQDAEEKVSQDLYYKMLTDLINQFRLEYENENLPVAVCQIAPYSNSGFVTVRQAQLDVTNDMDNVYLVTTADAGPKEIETDTIHPLNKMPIINRCFNIIKYALLGEDVAYSAPTYKSMTVSGNEATLTIDIGAASLKTSDGKAVTGFEIAGKDGTFYDATATISGNQITVSSASVANPVEVRYCYVPWAEDNNSTLGGNVVNSADIPMGPFKAQVPNVAIDSVTGSGYTYTVNLSNSAYNTAPGFVVAALYDGDELVQMKKVEFSINERKDASKTVTFNPEVAPARPRVKIMAWKSMTTLVPYCAAVDK